MTREEQFKAWGGRAKILEISKVFYDLVYEDEWLGQFFSQIDQEIIENQQADFITAALGGENRYCGQLPIEAHSHIMITDEIFEYRDALLVQAFNKLEVEQSLQDAWLKIDRAFKNKIVKKDLSECKKQFNTQEILDFPAPFKYKKAA